MRAVLVAWVVLVLLVVVACGHDDTEPPSETRVYAHDIPKPNYPRTQDTPESFAVPTTRGKVRVSRSKPRAVKPSQATESTEQMEPTAVGEDVWARLAMCESGMRQGATSANGLYLSYFQWLMSTWKSVGGVGDPRTVPYETQVVLAKRLQARSGWDQWPRCSRKLGLR